MNFARSFAVSVFAAALLVFSGCAAKVTTTGGTPAPPQPSQLVTDIGIAVAASEAVVPLLPNLSASVKAEVATGLNDFSTGLTCTNTAIASGVTGATLDLEVTGCFSNINIANFSASAQTYLSAVNAGIQAILKLVAPSVTVTSADVAQVRSLQARAVAVAVKASK
jgi:hypothetical protein